MSATNHTPNYNLPQFIGTDVPTWLTDVNGAMSDIDTAIAAAKSVADGAASDASSLDTRMTTAEGTIGTLSGSVTTLSGQVTAAETKIGTAALETTAQNLSGAINELNSGKLNASAQIIIKRMYTFTTKNVGAAQEGTWTATIAEYTGYRPFIAMVDDTGAAGIVLERVHFNSLTELALRVFNASGSTQSVVPKAHVYYILEDLINSIS